jgi:hypothetical protein
MIAGVVLPMVVLRLRPFRVIVLHVGSLYAEGVQAPPTCPHKFGGGDDFITHVTVSKTSHVEKVLKS